MRELPGVLVYAPFSFTGRGPAESCAAILSGFAPMSVTTELFAARVRATVAGHVRVHQSLPTASRRLPWRLVAAQALRRLDDDFARALERADPAHTIAYFWPDPPVQLVCRARERGIVTVREMINSACATSGPLLDAAYAGLGLPPTHGVTPAKIAVETAELQAYDYVFASNPEVEESLRRLDLEARILSTSFGWSPRRLGTSPAQAAPPAHGVRMVFVGSLSVRKGIPELLAAWQEADVDGELVLAGQVTAEVAGLVDQHVRGGRVRAIGYVEDVGAVLASADVFVFPTREEGGPQVTYEAAALGLPVITTPMGAARLVETGVTGIIVEAGSVSQLTEAIRQLADRRDLRRVYGENARKRADDFVYDKVGAQRCRLLLEALGRHHP